MLLKQEKLIYFNKVCDFINNDKVSCYNQVKWCGFMLGVMVLCFSSKRKKDQSHNMSYDLVV